ncbi:MAG: PQQ-binding-like beta-propeller repeat protein [Candidatus Omnitrophota bacterium]
MISCASNRGYQTMKLINSFYRIILIILLVAAWCVQSDLLYAQGPVADLYAQARDKNIFSYFDVRNTLLSMDYGDLEKLKNITLPNTDTSALKDMIRAVQEKKNSEAFFYLAEDILVRNVPLPARWQSGKGLPVAITSFDPQSEYAYFNNPRFIDRPQPLVRQGEYLWTNPVNLKSQKQSLPHSNSGNNQKITELASGPKSEVFNTGWSFEVEDDLLRDYVFDVRHWNKKYEENQMRPLRYKGAVFVRNEYRIFCLDAAKGTRLWAFALAESQGRQYYQSFSLPHLNPGGTEMYLDNGVLYTELSGTVIALKVADPLHPALVWKFSLGEYTLCARPVLSGNTLLCTVINSRKEIWVIGLSGQDGTVQWSSYIGTSSFTSPLCELGLVDAARVIVGTNHGVAVCLDPVNGNIQWIRRYQAKAYGLFEFYARNPLDRNRFNIEYDTQILLKGKDGIIYYKPHESEYLYALDGSTGDIVKEIRIDTDRFSLLSVSTEGMVYLLEKNTQNILWGIDMFSGQEIFRTPLVQGRLRGVINAGNLVVFKIDTSVYILRLTDRSLQVVRTDLTAGAWLVSSETGRFIICADERVIFYVDIYPTVAPPAIRDSPQVKSTREAEPFISFRDITIRSNTYPGQPGAIAQNAGTSTSTPAALTSGQRRRYTLRGEFLFPVPVEIVQGGRQAWDFLLFINFNQLLCVNDDKLDIRWEKKIFYNSTQYFYMYYQMLKAYLYGDILIIQDPVNVIAVDVRTGDLVWCFTVKGPEFETQIRGFFDPTLKKKEHLLYHLSAGYRDRIMMQTVFVDGRIVITRANRIYTVDPYTGYCYGKKDLDCVSVRVLKASLDRVFLVPNPATAVISFNANLGDEKRIPLDQDLQSKGTTYALNHLGNNVIALFSGRRLMIIDLMRERVVAEYKLRTAARYLESYNGQIALIEPFESLTLLRLNGDTLVEELKYDLKLGQEAEFMAYLADTENASFLKLTRLGNYYYAQAGQIFIPVKRNNDYAIAAIDLAGGHLVWETPINGLHGYFSYMSNGIMRDNTLTFLISAKDVDSPLNSTRLIEIDTSSGRVKKNTALTAYSVFDTKRNMLAESYRRTAYRLPMNDIVLEPR